MNATYYLKILICRTSTITLQAQQVAAAYWQPVLSGPTSRICRSGPNITSHARHCITFIYAKPIRIKIDTWLLRL